MAEHWIDAATALKLIRDTSNGGMGALSLCGRARAGLLKTRARLLTIANRPAGDVDLPQSFWWAGGHAAMEQNWAAGDFSTWIDRTVHWQAFGVTFALSGLLEMLSSEQRASTARRLSVVGDSAWIPARVAHKFAYEKAGVSIKRAGAVFLDHARLGFITGRAVLAQRYDGAKGGEPVWEEREWNIPGSFWQEFTRTKLSSQDWERGIFSGTGQGPKGPCLMKLSGVHFLTESLHVLLPATETAPQSANAPAEASSRSKAGGRPAQPWWDDMWCAVWGLINQGDLKPKTKAEVERAMLTWATLNGHEVSDAAVRPKARKLFEALNTEARNFLDT